MMSDNDVKLDDFNQPFKPFVQSNVNSLSSSLFKNLIREISEIRINTNKNLIFGSYEEEKGFKLTQQREEVDLRSKHFLFPNTFNQMSFITSGNTQIYYRDYRKLFEVIVQIGGFFNGIIYAANFFLYIYSNNMILWKCIYCFLSPKELEERLSNKLLSNNLRNFDNDINNINTKRNKNEGDLRNYRIENMENGNSDLNPSRNLRSNTVIDNRDKDVINPISKFSSKISNENEIEEYDSNNISNNVNEMEENNSKSSNNNHNNDKNLSSSPNKIADNSNEEFNKVMRNNFLNIAKGRE